MLNAVSSEEAIFVPSNPVVAPYTIDHRFTVNYVIIFWDTIYGLCESEEAASAVEAANDWAKGRGMSIVSLKYPRDRDANPR